MRPKPAGRLEDLVSVGPAAVRDLGRVGITSVEQLRSRDPDDLYDRLCESTGTRHDPCVRDVFEAAIAQACSSDLPYELRQWWTYSRRRRAHGRS